MGSNKDILVNSLFVVPTYMLITSLFCSFFTVVLVAPSAQLFKTEAISANPGLNF